MRNMNSNKAKMGSSVILSGLDY